MGSSKFCYLTGLELEDASTCSKCKSTECPITSKRAVHKKSSNCDSQLSYDDGWDGKMCYMNPKLPADCHDCHVVYCPHWP